MRDFITDLVIPLGVVFLVMIGFVCVIFVPIGWAGYAQCASQASKMDVPYSWGILQDCMVQLDGKWIPLDSYKVVKLRP